MKKFARESEEIKFMNKGTKQAFQYVVPKTIPVLVGYLFLGAAYGILMQVNGFGIGWTLISSIFIYAGSLQYLEVTLLVGLVSPVYAFLIGLLGSAACVVVFGASAFLIPAMLVIILALTCGYKREKGVERGIR